MNVSLAKEQPRRGWFGFPGTSAELELLTAAADERVCVCLLELVEWKAPTEKRGKEANQNPFCKRTEATLVARNEKSKD